MNRIVFDKHSPKAFILAANHWSDAVSVDDQVWSLVFNQSDSHPFHLYTTYGLKARLVQVYPDILSENQSLMTGDNFQSSPTVTHYSPGFLRIVCQLKSGLKLTFSAQTPEPATLLGTVSLDNLGEVDIARTLALVFHLIPLGKGKRSHAEKIGTHHILSAQTGSLSPVLFMTGGPTVGNSPYPALSLPFQLSPGESHSATWVLVSRHTREESLKSARSVVGRSWRQLQQAQVMNHTRQTLQIQTGNPDWNAAFHLAQTIPHTHFIDLSPDQPTPVVVRNRLPDHQAISPQLMADQDDLTALELNHLAQVLLPQRPDLLAALVKSRLKDCQQDGQLFVKRNTSPFIKPYREPPMLAGLSLEIFEVNRDQAFLETVFPMLCQVTQPWLFTHPGSTQGRPFTWQNLDQCQLYAGHFPFDTWEETGRGLALQYVESPALLTMLLREVLSLKKMAEILQDLVSINQYETLWRELRKKLDAFWNEKESAYMYRDVQSKQTPMGERLLCASYQEEFSIDHKFSTPQRLICHIQASDERTRVCHVTFNGVDDAGQAVVEVFKPGGIRWVAAQSHLTTKHLYTELKSIGVKGLGREDQIILESAGFAHHDITCLAPLWTGDFTDDRLNALLDKTINVQDPNLSRGLPEVYPLVGPLPEGLENSVNVLWNTLILQGLASNGYRETAADLFSNLMASIIGGLRDYHGFFPNFQVSDGRPVGKPNAISGLAPIRLFLEIAGVRILTPIRVALWGGNPFPWPFEVDWQGLSIRREDKRTSINFPDGSTCTYEGSEPVLVTPESGET